MKGRPKKLDARYSQVNIRLRTDELRELRYRAEVAGLTVGEFVRQALFGAPTEAW